MATKLNTIDELNPAIKQYIREVLADCFAQHIVNKSIRQVAEMSEKKE